MKTILNRRPINEGKIGSEVVCWKVTSAKTKELSISKDGHKEF